MSFLCCVFSSFKQLYHNILWLINFFLISFINFSVDCTIHTILAHRAFLEEFLLTPTKQVLQPKNVVEEKIKHNPNKINNLKQNWNAFGDWNFICGTRFINCSKYIENYTFYNGKCGPPLCAVFYSMGRCYWFGFGWPSFRWKVTRRNGWRYGVLVEPGREGDGAKQNLWVWCGGNGSAWESASENCGGIFLQLPACRDSGNDFHFPDIALYT